MKKQKHKENDNLNRKMIDFYKSLSDKELDRLLAIEESKIKTAKIK